MELLKDIKLKEFQGVFTTGIKDDYKRTWRIELKENDGVEFFKVSYIDLPAGYTFDTIKDLLLNTMDDENFNADYLESLSIIHLATVR